MKNLLLINILLVYSIFSFAQNTIEYNGENINALDENNNQIGIWKIFDENKNTLITCEFKDGIVAKTNYYTDSVLFASYIYQDRLEIYKDSKTIICYYFRKENGTLTLIDASGKEIDQEIIKNHNQQSQIMPMFYGGINKLYEFVGQNFNSNGKKGKIKVNFLIDKKGFTTQIEIAESTNPELNDEAIRVISSLPRWQPAHQKGIFVNFPYSIPININ